MAAMRSPRVFGHHPQALGAEDSKRSSPTTVTTPSSSPGRRSTRQGWHPPGVRHALLGEVPQATWDIKTTIYEDDILLLEWGAPRAATIVSRTASIPSSSATASSGSRPSRYTLQSGP